MVARTRAEAEDACALVEVEYEPLPAVTDAETALDPATPVIHSELGDNLTFERTLVAGDPGAAFAEADAVRPRRAAPGRVAREHDRDSRHPSAFATHTFRPAMR